MQFKQSFKIKTELIHNIILTLENIFRLNIADIKYNEPYRLEESKDNEVALNSFFIKNVYMIYGYFFNKLTKGYCTIIGFTREDDSGHYMVIAK